MGSILGPFVIGKLLGHGGMGIVYSATHRETGAEIALKTLHRVDVRAVARLKAEFRHLAKVRDPHLVQLYELHTIGRNCFLTMERVEGEPLNVYLSAYERHTAGYFDAVRDTFRQISEGLCALHEQGLLHLDLKPDNVMVDRLGKIRILDFGLVSPLIRGDDHKQRGIGGTPRYMAPERLERGEESTHSDWFSFGLMLAEQLVSVVHRLPLDLSFPADAPTDLVQLSKALLSEDPLVRPNDVEVASALGARRSGTYRTRSVDPAREPLAIVGREAQLSRLERGLSEARSGATRWIRLEGESGIGKTALMTRFRDSLRHDPGIAVFEGACHERESMPFQGLDGVLDGLAQVLRNLSLPKEGADRQLLQRAALLSDTFLDLSATDDLVGQPRDPLEQRRAAFAAIKELLVLVANFRTVVVLIDDVQWGDRDGARLLAELLASPSPARLLVITTNRTASGGVPPFLKEVEAILQVRGSAVQDSTLELDRLTALELEACVPTPLNPSNSRQRQAIVRASGGLPYLATALGSQTWEDEETPSLSSLIERCLKEAPSGAREVMEAISLSPAPLHQAVALEQVKNAKLRGAVLAALRNSNLVRTAGTTPDSPLEPYHSLVADTVRAHLSPASRQSIRERLAGSLEEKALATAEQLAHLYHLAHRNDHAARWAPLAALEAERALAFESAAHWYGRAASWSPREARKYLPLRARCLEYAGRSSEAAATYEECAALATDVRRDFVRAAGSAWLSSGHVDRGLAVLTPELKELGAPVPSSERIAMIRALRLTLRLWRRGIGYTPNAAEDCDPNQLSRIDAIWHAAKGLGAPFPLRGLVLQLECLAASLEAGERSRIARSLAVLGPMFVGTPWEKMGEKWTEQAHVISDLEKNSYLRGVLLTFDAVRMTAEWAPPARILERAAQGFELLKDERGPIVWEQSMAFTAGLRVREHLGLFEDLGKLGTLWLAESTSRGDLFALAMACQACAMNCLAAGHIQEAREFARRSVRSWTQGSYTVQHYYALRFDVQCDLMDGRFDAARENLLEQWRSLHRAQLLRHPISRPEILHLRGLVELAANSKNHRSAAVRKVISALDRDQSPIARPHAAALRSSCAWSSGDTSEAQRQHAIALSEYQRLGQLVHALCFELLFSQSTGNTTAKSEAREKLRASGVRTPELYAYIHAPAFRERVNG